MKGISTYGVGVSINLYPHKEVGNEVWMSATASIYRQVYILVDMAGTVEEALKTTIRGKD